MGNRFREKVTEEGLEEPVPQVEEPVVAEPAVEEESVTAVPPKRRKGGRAVKGVAKVLGGDLLADKVVLKQIPLLLLCLLFLLLIVANRYNVENLSREKQVAEERINYLREHRIQMQKQYQQSIKISQIAEDLREEGVGIMAGPPYEL